MEQKPRTVALIAGGLLVGAAAAGALVVTAANAATIAPSLTAASSGSSSTEGPAGEGSSGQGPSGQGRWSDPRQGMNPDEKPVSSAIEAKLKAAALKAVPGGTILRIETDSGDAVYEAHVRKSDGGFVTVKFDKGYAVTAVEDGMGKGGPGGMRSGGMPGGMHGDSDGDRPAAGGGESGSSSGT